MVIHSVDFPKKILTYLSIGIVGNLLQSMRVPGYSWRLVHKFTTIDAGPGLLTGLQSKMPSLNPDIKLSLLFIEYPNVAADDVIMVGC